MDEKGTEEDKFKHLGRRGSQIQISEPLLKLFVVLEKFEYLEDAKHTE